ncbi:MAG TPA: exodeoxyribonuclease V subunit alpha [Actinomycetota bacterium]|nr:exodeoxyribonuclease V subunit alpha [Actinomycetota bacterium]
MRTRLPLGRLEPFHDAGVLGVPDVQVAAALLRIGGGSLDDPDDAAVALGAGLCVRALRAGSVCVDLTADPESWLPEDEQAPEPLPWPDASAWVAAAQGHRLVSGPGDPAGRPLRLVGNLLYLQRYWQDEQVIRTAMQQRNARMSVDPAALSAGLQRLFPEPGPDRQRLAAATAALRQVSIIAGGPGTGKTTTVARILALLQQVCPRPLTVALAAPTGKAAARLQAAVAEAVTDLDRADRDRVGELNASTLHRLLGWVPDSQGRFRHNRANPLPHDVVVVDETSMVSLPLMARLLEAVRADARLLLVGDPDQLASIEAGAVLGDLVAAPAGPPDDQLTQALASACPQDVVDVPATAATGVVVLNRNYRFQGAIADLADAIRRGDPDRALAILRGGHPDVQFLTDDSVDAVRQEVAAQAASIVAAAERGDAQAALAALETHRVLCAHREGPHGVSHWDDLIREWTEPLVTRASPGHQWYAGRPLLVTANDYTVDLYNGDTGVVVATGDGQVRAAFSRGSSPVLVPVSRLDTVTTLRAMTVHRGQGSQFEAVTVVLPKADSPLATRELLYTAVTRARTRVRIIGTEEAVLEGIGRQVRRASGLRA